MSATPVVVVGDTLAELVLPGAAADASALLTLDPADLRARPGGAAVVTAAWLAHLGTPTTLVGRVGDDSLARAVTDDLERRRIDVRLAVEPSRPTGTVVVVTLADGETQRAYEAGAAVLLGPADLPADAFSPGRHLHLAGHALLGPGGDAVGRAAVSRARSAGMTVSAEPPPLAALEALDPADARAALTGVDLLVLGSAEAFALVEDEVETAADSRPQGTAALLARTVPEVVVTGGAAGAWWHGRRGEPVHVPAEPVAEVGPWAGAGREGVRPAFVAGLLAAWLLDAPPAQALRSGARVAAQALAGACPLP